MKILCVSDQIDPLVYSSSAKERFADVDVVLCAGDLAMEYVDFIVSTLNKPTYFVFGNHNLKEFHFYHPSAQRLNNSATYEVGHYTCSHGARYLGFCCHTEKSIFKNASLQRQDASTNGNAHKKSAKKTKAKKDVLLLAGASGSMLYNKGLCQYSDNDMFCKLFLMVPRLLFNKIKYGRYLDIFLTHSPPLNIHDKKDLCHKGFKCYRWFLSTFKPRYMIHGHIHLYDIHDTRVSQFEETTIINAFSHYILEFDKYGNGL